MIQHPVLCKSRSQFHTSLIPSAENHAMLVQACAVWFGSVLITQEFCISNAEQVSCSSWTLLMGDGDDIIIMGVIRRWTWLVTEFSVQTYVSWFSTMASKNRNVPWKCYSSSHSISLALILAEDDITCSKAFSLLL